MIITAPPETFPVLHDIQKECITALAPAPYTKQEVETWRTYLDEATPGRFEIFNNIIALDDARGSTPIGFVSWREQQQEKIASIECLYVIPDYQGHRIGSRLLRLAERGISNEATVNVRSTLSAEGFYQNQGYETTEDALSRAGFAIKIMQKTPKEYGTLRLVK